MAKVQRRREPVGPTKKQIRLSRREQQQQRVLIIGTLVVVLLVAGVLVAGYVNEGLLKPRQPVATVRLHDGSTVEITTAQFQERVRFERARFIPLAFQIPQFAE